MLLFIAFVSGTARAEFAGCQDCDDRFILTHDQLLCVEKRIERLIGRPEPVYFDAASCDQSQVKVMSSASPIIETPIPSPAPDEKWLQLTKKQLQCLQLKLPKLKESSNNPLEILLNAAECSGSTP
jgi:hypothetical protein